MYRSYKYICFSDFNICQWPFTLCHSLRFLFAPDIKQQDAWYISLKNVLWRQPHKDVGKIGNTISSGIHIHIYKLSRHKLQTKHHSFFARQLKR